MSADGRMGNRRPLEVNVGVPGFWWGAVVVVQTRLRFDVRGGSFLVLRVGWVYLAAVEVVGVHVVQNKFRIL